MEFLNEIFKKLNLSTLGFTSFTLLGLILYKILQIPTFISFINRFYLQSDLNAFPNNLLFILIWFLIFLTLEKGLFGLFKFLSSFLKYEFNSNDWPKKWEYQGNIRLGNDENSLLITDSNSGCILKNHYWKNLEINFECKFPMGQDDQTFGIIFRAKPANHFVTIPPRMVF